MAKKPREASPSRDSGNQKPIFGNPADFPEENDLPVDLDVDLGEISISLVDDSAKIKQIEESAGGIRKWMQVHLPKLDELRKAPKAIRIREQNKKAEKQIKDKIDAFMNHPEAVYRQAAWLEFLLHDIKTAPVQTYTEAIQWFSDMVEWGYLENGDTRSPLQAWKHYYRIPQAAAFTRPEFEAVKRATEELVHRVSEGTAKNRQGRLTKLQEEAEIEPQDVFAEGSKGKSLLFVPPQISDRDGKVDIRRGGFLLVGVEDDKIYPLEGIGSFEEQIATAEEFGLHVKLQSMEWDFPPSKKALEKAGFSEAQIRSLTFCWYLLKRTKTLLIAGNQHDDEKREMARDVSISQERFFLEKEDGEVLVDFEGVWENWVPDESDPGRQKKRELYDLFLLVGRQQGKICIVSCPPHLEEFFEMCQDEYDEGPKFSGVPQPLQAVLQAQYGAVQTKSLLQS